MGPWRRRRGLRRADEKRWSLMPPRASIMRHLVARYWLPLPAGEGWGEGRRSLRTQCRPLDSGVIVAKLSPPCKGGVGGVGSDQSCVRTPHRAHPRSPQKVVSGAVEPLIAVSRLAAAPPFADEVAGCLLPTPPTPPLQGGERCAPSSVRSAGCAPSSVHSAGCAPSSIHCPSTTRNSAQRSHHRAGLTRLQLFISPPQPSPCGSR
jgi:hypothetical protein